MFNLIYDSPYTVYCVDTFDTVEEAERDCETRYKLKDFRFDRGADGVLKQTISADTEVTLKLHKVDGNVTVPR